MKLGILALMSFAAVANAFGQATASGTIQGTVADASQAVITQAQVVATGKATGDTRTVMTDGSGNYRFDFLPAGAYTLKISKTGFSSLVQNVDVLVGQTATVNAVLNPGATTEIIEVSD